MDNDTTINQPQADWDPPGGELEFDSIFGGAGDDSGLPSTNQVAAEGQTTDPSEPVVQTTSVEPQAQPTPTLDSFVLKTNTGTVYKSLDEAARGIEQKDQLISQLRSMVSAVTGEDPIKASRTPSLTTNNTPVSYLRDSKRYAQDLSEAALLGQKTGNWDKYRDVQFSAIGEYINTTLGPYAPALQNVGKQQALDTVEKTLPEFKSFYNSDNYQKVLDARPKLADAIRRAEANPGEGAEYLNELYQIAYDTNQAMRLPELVKQNQQPSSKPTNTIPRTPMTSQLRPGVSVPDRNGPNSEPKAGMATSAGRRALMQELEAKGVLDAKF